MQAKKSHLQTTQIVLCIHYKGLELKLTHLVPVLQMILAPIPDSNESYIEFDLTGLPNQATKISFDYTGWNNSAVNNIKNTNRNALFALQVFRNGIWETLENTDGITNLKETLLNTYQTVIYLVPGNYKYRVILNTPGLGSNKSKYRSSRV